MNCIQQAIINSPDKIAGFIIGRHNFNIVKGTNNHFFKRFSNKYDGKFKNPVCVASFIPIEFTNTTDKEILVIRMKNDGENIPMVFDSITRAQEHANVLTTMDEWNYDVVSVNYWGKDIDNIQMIQINGSVWTNYVEEETTDTASSN